MRADCLIIGSGIAGLTAALNLGKQGFSVVVMTAAGEIAESNSALAQGGIIYEAEEGDPENLIKDILEAGCYSNHLPAVERMAEIGPALVRSVLIDSARVPFDKTSENKLNLIREGAHSEKRIVHIGDETGKSIEERLVEECLKISNIKFLTRTTAVNLLMTSYHSKNPSDRHAPGRCFGAFVFSQESKEVFSISASHTLLATGGIGQLFLHNTNNKYSRGDGIALAHRAGCRLENLEYVQFHPTTFFHPYSRRFLISEALRGEGAVLINREGKRFLKDYLSDYEIPELAPRDKVAKAIHQELLTSGAPSVFLDISHKEESWLKERFPFVYRNCLKFDVDISKEPIPVVPGAHYHCGGIWVDLEGKTSLPSLWGAGEVTCTGVHGANRLASTSLLEGLVWATSSANGIAKALGANPREEFPSLNEWQQEKAQVDPSFLAQDWMTLKQTMWNYAGLIKTQARLDRAEGILGELSRGIDTFYRKAVLSDELIGLRHATLTATLILEACKRNNRSLGCYLREEWEI